MKKWISIFLSAAFVFSLTACGTSAVEESTSSSGSTEANMTYTGTVSAITSQSITVSGSNGETVIKLSDSITVSRDYGMPGNQPQMGGGPSGGNGLPDGQREAPPEKPSEPSANSQDAPPEPPQGEAPEPMDGQPQSLTIADISVGDTVTVKTDSTGTAESILLSGGKMDIPEKPDGAMGGPDGMASGVDSYDAATAFPADAEESGGTYCSTGADENAVHVSNGASVTLENASILGGTGKLIFSKEKITPEILFQQYSEGSLDEHYKTIDTIDFTCFIDGYLCCFAFIPKYWIRFEERNIVFNKDTDAYEWFIRFLNEYSQKKYAYISVYDAESCMQTLCDGLSDRFRIVYGPVRYESISANDRIEAYKSGNIAKIVFSKDKHFAYQKEYRLFLYPKEGIMQTSIDVDGVCLQSSIVLEMVYLSPEYIHEIQEKEPTSGL